VIKQPAEGDEQPELTEEQRAEKATEQLENISVHFGKVEVPPLVLS